VATPGPLIRSQVVPAFLARLAALGVDLDPLVRRFHLPEPSEGLRDLEVPLSVVRELPVVAEELLGDPYAGLHVAEWLPRGAYGLIEFIVRSARDLRDAAGRLVRHHALFNDLTELLLEDRPGELVLLHRIPGEPACVGRHGNELVLAMMVRVLRESLGRERWTPLRVTFAHPPPPDVGPLKEYFGVERVEFDRGHNELAVSLDDAALPLTTADAALLAVLDEQAMRLIASRPGDGDAFWSLLREHLRVSLRDGAPRLEAAAEALGTSARTLQRRLEERGTSFQDLVDEIRRDLACMYLEGGSLAPLDVAFLLGYSDRRAFVRAFKRWTGKTPSGWRKG
jgi:AraC-like DNA-binding protein